MCHVTKLPKRKSIKIEYLIIAKYQNSITEYTHEKGDLFLPIYLVTTNVMISNNAVVI